MKKTAAEREQALSGPAKRIDMDPIANLKEQLQLAQRFIRLADGSKDSVSFDENEVTRLAELVIALDEWQRRGGSSPYICRLRDCDGGSVR